MDPTLDPMTQALNAQPNYLNPAYMTPEQAANLRATADQLMKGSQTESKSWAGVLGSFAQALAGKQLRDQAASGDRFALQAAADRFNPANFGGAGQSQPQASGGMMGSAPPGQGSGAAAASGGGAPGELASFYSDKLGPAGAAGLVGGFGAESSFRPGASGDNGASVGYAQWQGSRRKNLEAYAAKYGASPADPQVQKQFPLVEMGLSGDPNDPGFGTERRAGQALQAAQNPQQATAAALMYERPGGYTPQNPQAANGYDRRLALASALMGRPAAPGPQMAGNGPMAYAASSAPQSGAGVPWPAQRPQTPVGAGAQPQAAPGPAMTQAAPQGSPLSGMGAAQIGSIMADPRIPDHIKREILMGQIPQPIGTPGGGTVMQPSLQPVSPRTVSPGVLSTPFGGTQEYAPASGEGGAAKTLVPGGFTSTLGVGGQSIPSVTTIGQGGQPNTHLVMPGGEAGAGGGGNPLAPVMPLVHAGQGIAAAGNELNADTEAMGAYKTQGATAASKLGQMETFRALGQGIESGLPAQVKGKLAQYGFDLDSTAGRLQAYKFMAMMLLPQEAGEGIRESIPTLSADPQTRGQIADFIENQYKYQKQIGDIAADNKSIPDASERRRRINALKPPQQTFGGGGEAPPAPAGAAPSAPASAPDPLADARMAISKGAPREAVVKRLRERGINPAGL